MKVRIVQTAKPTPCYITLKKCTIRNPVIRKNIHSNVIYIYKTHDIFYSKTGVRRKPNQLPRHWDCGNLRQNIPDSSSHLILIMYRSAPEVQNKPSVD